MGHRTFACAQLLQALIWATCLGCGLAAPESRAATSPKKPEKRITPPRRVPMTGPSPGITATPGLLPDPAPSFASIPSRLKKEVLKRVIEDREVMTHADLEDEEKSAQPGMKRYEFYATMLANASVSETRRVLTNYALYEKMIPYVSKASFEPEKRLLAIEGGIFGFRMSSSLRIDEIGDRAIRYRIVSGHFTGMSGEILFEPSGERGTLVYVSGRSRGVNWPPAFVVERGAEIVFGFTGRRMRSYIESKEGQSSAGGGNHDPGIPQPRSHRH